MSSGYIVTLVKEIIVLGGSPSEARETALRRHQGLRVSRVRRSAESVGPPDLAITEWIGSDPGIEPSFDVPLTEQEIIYLIEALAPICANHPVSDQPHWSEELIETLDGVLFDHRRTIAAKAEGSYPPTSGE